MSAPIALGFMREMLRIEPDGSSAAAVAKAELCTLDFLSCAYAGRQLPWAQQAIDAAGAWPQPNGAVVIGTELRVPPGEAGFINSVMAASASRTDMHPAIASHVAPIVFPTAFACAAIRPVSGAAFVAAVIAGYEAEARLGRVLVDARFSRHFRATSVLGSVGAAVVAARLLALDEARAVNALSISVNAAAGLMEWGHSGEVDLFYQPANAVRAAVSAALLARAGATSSATIFEGPGGMLAAFGGLPRADELLTGSDDGFEIERVDFKAVPACVFVQAAAFASVDLLTRHGPIDVGSIDRIRLRTFAAAIAYPGCDNAGGIDSIQAARMSLQHTVASVIARGKLSDANFSDLRDGRTADLTPQIELEETDEFTRAFPARQGAELRIVMRNGALLSGRVEAVPDVDPGFVRERFAASARAVVGDSRASQTEALCLRLAESDSLQPLLELLTRAPE